MKPRKKFGLYPQKITQKKQSAGGVIYRKKRGGLQIYLAKHREYGFVLPKGGRKPGESWSKTALREVKEETGFLFEAPSCFVGKIAYCFERGGEVFQKEVRFFAFEVKEDTPRESLVLEEGEKIEEGEWFIVQEAVSKLTHQSEKEMVIRLEKIIEDESKKD